MDEGLSLVEKQEASKAILRVDRRGLPALVSIPFQDQWPGPIAINTHSGPGSTSTT